jgi:dienelactone hydrolase
MTTNFMRKFLTITLLIALFSAYHVKTSTAGEKNHPQQPEKVQFNAADGLPITAHLYHLSEKAPVIVLCHQALFNKHEYAGVAERLNSFGFNCLAIDQRSGGPIANYINETNLAAVKAGKGVDFLDAEPDLVAALKYADQKYHTPIVLWGSSYSSTLALYIGAENEMVNAVVSFSPGNYLADKRGDLVEKLKDYKRPLFVTSSKREAPRVTELMKKMQRTPLQRQFIPEDYGHHGSRALWKYQRGGKEYWDAIEKFLKDFLATVK